MKLVAALIILSCLLGCSSEPIIKYVTVDKPISLIDKDFSSKWNDESLTQVLNLILSKVAIIQSKIEEMEKGK